MWCVVCEYTEMGQLNSLFTGSLRRKKWYPPRFLQSHLCSTNQQLTLIHNIFCLLNEHSEFSYSVSWKSNVFVAEINHYSAAGSGSNELESRRSSRVSTLWLPGERELEVAAVGIWISAPPPPSRWIRATQPRHIWSKHRYRKRFLVEPTRVVEKRGVM